MGKTKLRIIVVALLIAVALITAGCEKVTEAETVTVAYDLQGGTSDNPPAEAKYVVGEKVTPPAASEITAPAGKQLAGWNTAGTPTATSTAVAVGGEYTVVASDADETTGKITLYAQWEDSS